jgi:hypothetical protein
VITSSDQRRSTDTTPAIKIAASSKPIVRVVAGRIASP